MQKDLTTGSAPVPQWEGDYSKDGNKFFYFHKTGVKFEQARDDLSFCYRFLNAKGLMQLPMFVAWDEDLKRKTIEPNYGQWGLVGVLIGGAVENTLLRQLNNAKMRACMEPRGYQMFAMPKEAYQQIYDADTSLAISKHAKLASGPEPKDKVITE
jgi:hypothetical protein